MSDHISPRTDREILFAAAKGLGRVDLHGLRGITLLSVDEIEAMALALLILGLAPVKPGTRDVPPRLVYPRLSEYD